MSTTIDFRLIRQLWMFLAVAEETGLSLPIGLWSLVEACKQVKKWQKECDSFFPQLW